MNKVFVTGTDTEIGKTLVCSGLCVSTGGFYWKPIQTGVASEMSDAERVSQYIAKERILPTAFSFQAPLSPNQAARQEGKKEVFIKELNSTFNKSLHNLVIEGVGGLLVPINKKESVLDLIDHLKAPVLVVARSTLGTLNHTFLTLKALRAKKIPVLGVILTGPPHPENKKDIEQMGKTKVLLELPVLSHPILKKDLLKHFAPLKNLFLET